VVEGDLDTNAPLVIDPSSLPSDPDTIEIPNGGYPMVGFIQSMPVTKMVDRVTVGDVGRGTGCPSSTGAHLLVNEHANGDLNGRTQIRNSVMDVPLAASPGAVSFSIQPAVFKKGLGYSFQLVPSALCPLARTTWTHNGPTINGGSVRCAAGPPASQGATSVGVRMWHETGQADRAPECVSRPESWAFDPSMPTGWLVPDPAQRWVSGGTFRDTQPPGPSDDTANCETSYAAHGATLVYWRAHPTSTGWSQYVCIWPQYEPRNQTTADGWYHGIPWKGDGTGTPRDTYLKLETIDYDALLTEHAPILHYDSDELFHALSPGALTDYHQEAFPLAGASTLKDGLGEFANAHPALADNPDFDLDLLRLGYLGSFYPSGGDSGRAGSQGSASDFVSARGNEADDLYQGDSSYMEAQDGYPGRIMSRVAFGSDDRLWLQYWLFYYANPRLVSEANVVEGPHEGDWEWVQIRLTDTLAPDLAAYSQHGEGQYCEWSSVDRSTERPNVYVALDSHANYFSDGSDPDAIPPTQAGFPPRVDTYPWDTADGGGGTLLTPDPMPIDETSPSWIAWPGTWGDSESSPGGPRFQDQEDPARRPWGDPSAWAASRAPC
jgi:hypothetical protein